MKDAAILIAAVVAGFFMLAYDQRTDDTDVEVALLVAISLALGVAAPRRALAVGLGVGLPIAVWSVMNGNSAGVAALAFALIGAGLGWLTRRGSLAAA
ncbi:MAG TPA: hypothetical protein VGR85_05440 [Candidatus Limnocylindria bacterium]|nr:hypothetical protein [Candidatus Limnocylindria bacterium]